jgi:hypothetical protein
LLFFLFLFRQVEIFNPSLLYRVDKNIPTASLNGDVKILNELNQQHNNINKDALHYNGNINDNNMICFKSEIGYINKYNQNISMLNYNININNNNNFLRNSLIKTSYCSAKKVIFGRNPINSSKWFRLFIFIFIYLYLYLIYKIIIFELILNK